MWEWPTRCTLHFLYLFQLYYPLHVRTNKFIIRRLLLYTKIIAFFIHVYDVWSLTCYDWSSNHVSDQTSYTFMENAISCVYRSNLLMMNFLFQTCRRYFYVLLTVHFSNIFDFMFQLNAPFLYYIYYVPLHVSSNFLLIIRRIHCIHSASGSLYVILLRWPLSAQAVRVL